jgi:hypothetical protein
MDELKLRINSLIEQAFPTREGSLFSSGIEPFENNQAKALQWLEARRPSAAISLREIMATRTPAPLLPWHPPVECILLYVS